MRSRGHADLKGWDGGHWPTFSFTSSSRRKTGNDALPKKSVPTSTRTSPLSEIVGQLKKSSNDWLRSKDASLAHFYWQSGYGAFSVSQSSVLDVRGYILNQHDHQKHVSFQDELRAFLKRYEVDYDQRYVWDRMTLAPFQGAIGMRRFPQGIGLTADALG